MRPTNEELMGLCDCASCPIAHRGLRNPVFGTGNDKPVIMLVGEAAGPMDQQTGQQFTGQSGHLLDSTLQRAGIDRSQVFTTNTVACFPGPNPKGGMITPDPQSIRACSKRLARELEATKPEVIVSLGGTSAQTLLQTQEKITNLQGAMAWSDVAQAWVIPTWHPAYVFRKPDQFDAFSDDIQRAVAVAQGSTDAPPRDLQYKYTHILPGQVRQAVQVLNDINEGLHGNVIALDIESGGFDYQVDPLLQVAMANEEEAWVFEAGVLFDEVVYDALYTTLCNPDLTWVMHNMSFDLQWLRGHFGIHWSEFNNKDTMCLALSITEQGQAIGLKALSRKYFNAPFYEDKIKQYLPSSSSSYATVPREVLAEYAGLDVIYTARLYPTLCKEARANDSYKIADGLLMDAQRLFADMEYHGVAIDLPLVDRVREEWGPIIEQRLQKIQRFAVDRGWREGPLNPKSSVQMGKFLFDHMGYNPPSSQKVNQAMRTGQKPPRHTGKEFYEEYPDEPITQLLRDYKLADKMLTTYVEGIVDDIAPDNRVHPDFLLFGAVTGRLTIRNPPLQTIPRGDTSGSEFSAVKDLFVARARPESGDKPDDPYIFVAADYKQLELRIAWHLSQDPAMGEAILSGDFHSLTASRIFNKPVEAVTSTERHNTKYVTFGIMYGRTAYALYKGELGKQGLSITDCEAYERGWLEQFPIYAKKREEWQYEARHSGVLRSDFGRIRHWGLITNDNLKDIMNQALNFPVQSAASDMNLAAAVRINNMLREQDRGRLLFLVHDSIECEVRESNWQETVRMIEKEMITPPFETVAKFAVDIEVGPSWGGVRAWKG